jgi:hypothetical protein
MLLREGVPSTEYLVPRKTRRSQNQELEEITQKLENVQTAARTNLP